jgi:hypothetical protein
MIANTEIQEIKEKIIRNKEFMTSNAERINNLMLKQKKFLRIQQSIVPFKEPVMFFERRSGDVEFYENVTVGNFEFKHSDGTRRFLLLTPSKQKRFGYGKWKFKGYFCHEDFPLPLPQDPLITTEQMNIFAEKSMNDIKEWQTKAIKAKTDMIWKIALGIALVIGAYALYNVLSPKAPPVQEIQNTVPLINKTIIQPLIASLIGFIPKKWFDLRGEL